MRSEMEILFISVAITFATVSECVGYYTASDPYGRRFAFDIDITDTKSIVGAPSLPSHLPEAEPILPGHTLIRPTLGMLKSSIKFPHRELENGAGVDGNIDNLGIKWMGRNERILYTGFRRSNPGLDKNVLDGEDLPEISPQFRRSGEPYNGDYRRDIGQNEYQPAYRRLLLDSGPYRKRMADYVMVIPTGPVKSSPSFSLSNVVLDLEGDRNTAEKRVTDRWNSLARPGNKKRNDQIQLYISDPQNAPLYLTDLFKTDNSFIF